MNDIDRCCIFAIVNTNLAIVYKNWCRGEKIKLLHYVIEHQACWDTIPWAKCQKDNLSHPLC